MNLRHAVTLVCSLVALAASTASAGVYSDYVINNTDPVIYWGQNEASGATAFDSVTAGGANDGTYAAAGSHAITLGDAGPRPSDGFFNMDAGNNAPFVSYQGTTKYNSLNSVAGVGTGSYSVQLWFNSSVPFTDNYLQYVFTRGSGTGDADRRDGVYVGGNYSGIVPNKLHLTTGIAGSHTLTIGSRTLSEDTWYHFLFVRDGDDCKAYINGKLEVQHTDPWDGGDGEYLTAANRTDYESFASSNGLGVHGRYDEVAVWDRALSDYEASNLYLQAFDTQDKPYMAAVLRNAPEAYWQLNETTGTNTAADATGNGHNVAYYTPVYSSTPTRTGTGTDVGPRPAEFGGFTADNNAPTLPGDEHAPGDDDGFVIVPQNVLNGQNDYSAEMWFRRGSLGTYGAYLMHRNDLGNGNGGDYLGLWQDGRLFIYDGNAPGISGTTQTAQNEWYHVGIARSGDNVTVYLNGLPEITTTMASWGEDWVDGTWTFGGRNDARHDLGQEFSGNIDEIAIYGEALGQNDFQENYLTAKVRRDSPYAQSVLSDTPEAYWRLDETSPYTLAVDAAGHGHTFEYHASASRTGTGSDVGPSSPAYIGFEPDNNAPRLEGTPNTSYIGIAEDLLAGQNDYTPRCGSAPTAIRESTAAST